MKLTVDKYFILSCAINLMILFLALLSSANSLFVLVLLIWFNMMVYAYRYLEQRSLLFAFGIAFFVFLLGRDLLEQIFLYRVEDFSSEVNRHAYLCMFIALTALWCSYNFFSRKRGNNDGYSTTKTEKIFYINYVQKISKCVFYFTYPFAIVSKFLVVKFVLAHGYTEYYTDYALFLNGNNLLYIVSKIEIIMPVALCIFMATLPSKKKSIKPLSLYLVYLFLSLGSGQRSTFMLGLLLIFVFVVYMQTVRPSERWFKRKYLIYCLLLVPAIAIMSTVYNIVRFGGNIENIKFFESFCNFFYDQGVSSNIIKRAFMYKENIPGDCIYFFEFLHSGALARLFGITVYNGNTIEHALYGNSFTHALGYTILGNGYLAGRGTGTSYIAELYYDFGYIGVALGSALYGWIFTKMKKNKRNSIFSRAIVFVIVTQLLWAPRGSFTGFISFLNAPSTLGAFIVIFGGAKLLLVKNMSKRINT